MRRLSVVLLLAFASTAYAGDPPDTPWDPSVDECAAPDAGCQPERDIDDVTLDRDETAAAETVDPIEWDTSAAMTCPDGSQPQQGTCMADASVAAPPPAESGCATGGHAGLIVIVAIAGLVALRKKQLALALAFVACAQQDYGWDAALDDGALAGTTTDVFAADLATGTQYLLSHQPLAAGAAQPVAAFALSTTPDSVPVGRVATACGDQLVVASAGSELLGYARATAGAGTAELVELADPNGCHAYATDSDRVAALVAEGYAITNSLGYVWPPGMTDPVVAEPTGDDDAIVAAQPACKVSKSSPVELLYASPGAVETLRFLIGCPGEVIVGEKREDGPIGAMKSAAAHAQGGRSGFVLDRNGDKLRELLNRSNGVERTAAYLRHKLASGYDYIVIDEVTSASDFADGQGLNHELRQLLLRMPARTIIPYISIDLTQESIGAAAMPHRRLLLRAFKKRARVLALEVYLHTAQVMAGESPSVFRRATDRLGDAIRGLAGAGGINGRSIITIGTSMHSTYAQYR
ncbi:MAG TPA: hypothetical protein VFQ65_09875, partial [Kofleriaceae bacterium]|nr:hypothetical protein [Kofleriaceae bacterium]